MVFGFFVHDMCFSCDALFMLWCGCRCCLLCVVYFWARRWGPDSDHIPGSLASLNIRRSKSPRTRSSKTPHHVWPALLLSSPALFLADFRTPQQIKPCCYCSRGIMGLCLIEGSVLSWSLLSSAIIVNSMIVMIIVIREWIVWLALVDTGWMGT